MRTEWNEENIKEHMFTEVEVSSENDVWFRHKLGGFCSLNCNPFISDRGGAYRRMRLIPKPKKRLMKPIELAGKWLDFGDDGMNLVIGYDEELVFTRDDSFDLDDLNELRHNCTGWRDTPTSELNTSFEVDDE